MKIAICSQDQTPESLVDSRFGRTPFFAILDTDTDSWSYIENKQNLNASEGAGLQSAQTILDSEAEVLLAVNIGPKAMNVMNMEQIKVMLVPANTKVTQAIALFKEDKLNLLDQANVSGHWV